MVDLFSLSWACVKLFLVKAWFVLPSADHTLWSMRLHRICHLFVSSSRSSQTQRSHFKAAITRRITKFLLPNLSEDCISSAFAEVISLGNYHRNILGFFSAVFFFLFFWLIDSCSGQLHSSFTVIDSGSLSHYSCVVVKRHAFFCFLGKCFY